MNSEFHRIGSQFSTPAFVIAGETVRRNATTLRRATKNFDCQVLYAAKACPLEAIFRLVKPFVDGFAVASPGEARVACGFTNGQQSLHITTPGFKKDWFDDLAGITHVAFNSLSQFERLMNFVPSSASTGIRINPEHSHLRDVRYNPCRQYSKLGVPISELVDYLNRGEGRRVEGIHFHNGCLCTSWTPLLKTVEKIAAELDSILARMKWINLGGGFIWDKATDFAPLQNAVRLLNKYALEVFIEPGAGFVNSACYIVASVVDLFKRDGKAIAVLDTTVNHLPEVFEYQFEPDVVEHVDSGQHEYILAGCTCLAGDLFGEYSFDTPLKIGSRVTFENIGAYSLAKAHMFNGIQLPSIYALDQNGELELIKQFALEDFVNRFSSQIHEYANS